MEKEEYNNLIHRIKKSYPEFKSAGEDGIKTNKYLCLVKGNYEARIGWSHRNIDYLIYGIIFKKKKLYEFAEVNFKDLKDVFDKVKELLDLIDSEKIKEIFENYSNQP